MTTSLERLDGECGEALRRIGLSVKDTSSRGSWPITWRRPQWAGYTREQRCSIQALDRSIADYAAFETHDAFVKRIRAKHGRKTGFGAVSPNSRHHPDNRAVDRTFEDSGADRIWPKRTASWSLGPFA
jgi:hypothetical protein